MKKVSIQGREFQVPETTTLEKKKEIFRRIEELKKDDLEFKI